MYMYMYMYVYVYVYEYMYICPGVQCSRPPPQRGGGPPGWAPASRICMPCMCLCLHVHSFASIYAFAYPHLHMHALRMHASIYAHGMSAPTYACMACMHICKPHAMCTSAPHPQGGVISVRSCIPAHVVLKIILHGKYHVIWSRNAYNVDIALHAMLMLLSTTLSMLSLVLLLVVFVSSVTSV